MLLLIFAALSWSAVIGKSPTADESYHALAGWLHLWKGEYRYDSEDPPLWNMLAATLTTPGMIKVDPTKMDWSNLPIDTGGESRWEVQMLYRTPGNDALAFINRSRAVMLLVAMAMGGVLGGFVWQLSRASGATASAAAAGSVFATALFALDPNFLAHGSLVKNDVASSLALLGLTFCTWAAGRMLTPGRVLALAIWSGTAMAVKFSGPLLVTLSGFLLLLRAITRRPWPIKIGRSIVYLHRSRVRRIATSAGVLAAMGLVSFITIWLVYGLRFAPAKEPGAQMNMRQATIDCLINVWQAERFRGGTVPQPTQNDILVMKRPQIVRLSSWANSRRVLPQAFIAGLLSTYSRAQTRATFLCGQSSDVGTWWYFPFAMSVKTPVATIACIGIMLAWAARGAMRRRGDPTRSVPKPASVGRWTALCLGVPVAIYLGSAMSANLNLGVRHVLPVYPLLFAAVGLGAAKLWDWRRKTAVLLGIVAMTGLAAESCCAYPNYIPFFNILAGGSRGGLRLLSDSNLDWGQDLPLLADWQRHHPEEKLYLAYFGNPDPAYYGIRYTNIAEGYSAGPPEEPLASPGVLAISATTLQGPYCGHGPDNLPTWSMLWKLKPFEVLGGSIYLFHVPAMRGDFLPPGQSLIE